jgi:undecaprenyl diphosphate synthase
MITHLACIMDGNRRWAKKHGIAPWLGHKEGVKAVEAVVNFCLQNNIPYLSLYTFSIENFNRSLQEKSYFFDILFPEVLTQVFKQLIEKKIRVRFIGDRALFPTSVAQQCVDIEKKTEQFTTLTLNLLFCYGGRQEITAAVIDIANDVKNGTLALTDINEQYVYKRLWLGNSPEPELIIRTGDTKRLSNYMLYQCAYSELYFLNCLWPDLSPQDLENALKYYQSCKRNLGA